MYLYHFNPGCSAVYTPVVLNVMPSPAFATVAAAGNGLHP